MGNGPNVDNQHWENSFMAQGATPWNEKQLLCTIFMLYIIFHPEKTQFSSRLHETTSLLDQAPVVN